LTHEDKLITKIGGSQSYAYLKKQVCKIGEFNINYVEAGPSTKFGAIKGSPVILIHGANIGWGQWYQNIKPLAEHFKVYAIDLPGAGGSSRIDFSKMDPEKALVDVVLGFIKYKNLGRFNIVGHSIGGWVALKLAIDSSEYVDKLILVNSLGFSNYVPPAYWPVSFRGGANLISRTAMSPTRDNMRKFLADVLYNNVGLVDDIADYYHEAVIRGGVSHPLMMINRLFNPFQIRQEFILRDSLSKISAPTLIISSDKDPLIPLHKQAPHFSHISNSQVEIFKDTGHVPPMERSVEFNNIVIKFLTQKT
jgi:pimeloyl-ACP methyl ester carboxylesterase